MAIVEACHGDAVLEADAEPSSDEAALRLQFVDDLGSRFRGGCCLVESVRVFVKQVTLGADVQTSGAPFLQVPTRKRFLAILNEKLKRSHTDPVAGMRRPFLTGRDQIALDQG